MSTIKFQFFLFMKMCLLGWVIKASKNIVGMGPPSASKWGQSDFERPIFEIFKILNSQLNCIWFGIFKMVHHVGIGLQKSLASSSLNNKIEANTYISHLFGNLSSNENQIWSYVTRFIKIRGHLENLKIFRGQFDLKLRKFSFEIS